MYLNCPVNLSFWYYSIGFLFQASAMLCEFHRNYYFTAWHSGSFI